MWSVAIKMMIRVKDGGYEDDDCKEDHKVGAHFGKILTTICNEPTRRCLSPHDVYTQGYGAGNLWVYR